MTVVLRPNTRTGQTLPEILAVLGTLAAGEKLQTGDRGVVVSDELAQRYLNTVLPLPAAPPPVAPKATAATKAAAEGAARSGSTGGESGRAATPRKTAAAAQKATAAKTTSPAQKTTAARKSTGRTTRE